MKTFSLIYDDYFPINKSKKPPLSLGYKKYKEVIQEKTKTVRKIFEKEVPKR